MQPRRIVCAAGDGSFGAQVGLAAHSALGWCLFHGTERYGTEWNAGLFHGTDKCDHGTINLILEYLTRNGLIRICKVWNDKLYY